jgi:tryptophan 2,3-dioxygenase
MVSEWMKVMLEEIERKRNELRQAQIEEQMRAVEQVDARPPAVRQRDDNA